MHAWAGWRGGLAPGFRGTRQSRCIISTRSAVRVRPSSQLADSATNVSSGHGSKKPHAPAHSPRALVAPSLSTRAEGR